jgi:hypothetical protein
MIERAIGHIAADSESTNKRVNYGAIHRKKFRIIYTIVIIVFSVLVVIGLHLSIDR